MISHGPRPIRRTLRWRTLPRVCRSQRVVWRRWHDIINTAGRRRNVELIGEEGLCQPLLTCTDGRIVFSKKCILHRRRANPGAARPEMNAAHTIKVDELVKTLTSSGQKVLCQILCGLSKRACEHGLYLYAVWGLLATKQATHSTTPTNRSSAGARGRASRHTRIRFIDRNR